MTANGEEHGARGGRTSAATNDGDEPNRADNTDDTNINAWETGLRRRRGRSGNEDSSLSAPTNRNNNEERQRLNMLPDSSHRSSGGNEIQYGGYHGSSTTSGGLISSGTLGVSGPCGGGVDTMTTTPIGPLGGFGGSSPHTPSKNPTKDSLVAATPSSATTAGETVDSTMCCSLATDLQANFAQNGRLGNRRPQPSLRRQYQILESQTMLLFGSASIGFVLFLVFVLPFAALVSLALMTISFAALVPVASSAIQARYEIEMEHPQGLLRYLPDSLRTMLTETSLHDYMTDTTFMMENRHLMLYFIPGLDPDQLMGYINQLPPRHREMLLQPGLGRLMPSIMNRLVRADGSAGGSNDSPQLENGARGDISTASGLTFDRDDHGNRNENGRETDMEVTFLEAITSLRETVMGSSSTEDGNETPRRSGSVRVEGVPTHTSGSSRNCEDENSSLGNDDGAIDLVDTREGRSVEGLSEEAIQNVIVEVPQSENSNSIQSNVQNQLDNRQEEYDLEARVLSEAASAAVANFSAQASEAATESGLEAAETATSWFIRAGSLTGIIAGGGGVAAAIFVHRPLSSPLTITLGSMGALGSRGSPEGVPSRNSSDSVNSSGGHRAASSRLMRGLLATSAVGFISAGVAYLVRNRARAAIAERRQKKASGALSDKGTNEPKDE